MFSFPAGDSYMHGSLYKLSFRSSSFKSTGAQYGLQLRYGQLQQNIFSCYIFDFKSIAHPCTHGHPRPITHKGVGSRAGMRITLTTVVCKREKGGKLLTWFALVLV